VKNRMFTNIVMLGAITDLTGIVSEEAMREAVRNSVPRATVEKNLAALEEGFALAREIKEVSDIRWVEKEEVRNRLPRFSFLLTLET